MRPRGPVERGRPPVGHGPYNPGGAVQGKVTDSDLAAHMALIAHAGHPCGEDFLAKPFLAAHPEYDWQLHPSRHEIRPVDRIFFGGS